MPAFGGELRYVALTYTSIGSSQLIIVALERSTLAIRFMSFVRWLCSEKGTLLSALLPVALLDLGGTERRQWNVLSHL